MQVKELPELFRADRPDRLGQSDLRRRVPEKTVMPRNDDFGRPVAGGDSEEPEFNRQEFGIFPGQVDEGVNAPDKGGDDLLPLGMIGIELLPEVAPEFQEPRPEVALDRFLSQNLGDRSCGLSPPELKLKQAVRSDIKALGKKEVVLVLGKDMGNSPPVFDYLHRPGQALDFEIGLGGNGFLLAESEGDATNYRKKPDPDPFLFGHLLILPAFTHLIAKHSPCHHGQNDFGFLAGDGL